MPTEQDLKAAAEALTRGEVRKEITKEDDLKNVMRQIQQLEQSKALTGGDSSEPVSTAEQAAPSPPPLAQSDAPAPSAAPVPPRAPPPAPPWLHNIVQVISKEGRHFGRIFQLGDIKDGKAHGYIIKEHGDRDYVTVPSDHIAVMCPARIKLKQACSDKWVSDHMEAK
jgi:hypothetical protein